MRIFFKRVKFLSVLPKYFIGFCVNIITNFRFTIAINYVIIFITDILQYSAKESGSHG